MTEDFLVGTELGKESEFGQREKKYFDNLTKHPAEKIILENISKDPILDVGCGNGCLLNALKDKFEVEGFDPSEYAVKLAQENGLNVYLNTIKSFTPNKKYKTILLTGVIAHLYDLDADFRRIVSWLDKDGELFVIMQNRSSPFIKLHETHINTFNVKEFRIFAKRFGLKIKKSIGAGRLRNFPSLSTINLYILERI